MHDGRCVKYGRHGRHARKWERAVVVVVMMESLRHAANSKFAFPLRPRAGNSQS